MRRLLLTADWHLSDNPRDAYRFAAVDQLRVIAEKHSVTDLFVLGDMTDSGDHHSASFTNHVADTLTRLATQCCVHIIRGTLSHDGSDPAVPFFRFINQIEGLRYIVEPTLWQADDYFRALLVPHGQWPQQLPDGIGAVFAHETFAGVRAENGTQLPGLRLPITDVRVFSGDVHVPQRHGQVTYVGAPTLIKFGDSYQPRVLILDLDRHEQNVAVIRSISITGPTKRLVAVVAHPDGRIVWPKGEVNKGDIVKVRVSFAGAIPSLAHLRADIAGRISKLGAVLHTVEPVTTQRTTHTPRMPVARSDEVLVRQYADAHRFDKPTVEMGLAIVKGRGA